MRSSALRKREEVSLEEFVGLFFRGKYQKIALDSLIVLKRNSMTTKELAEVLDVPRSSLSDVLVKMEKLGMVYREWRYSPWRLSTQIGRKMQKYFQLWKNFYSAKGRDTPETR